jgi:pimeloyl-ACP methyl ester carboxylesterase
MREGGKIEIADVPLYISGTQTHILTMSIMKKAAFVTYLVLMICFPGRLQAQSKFEGFWTGGIAVLGSELNIAVSVTPSGDSLRATIDIPQQGAMNLPLRNVRYSSPVVYFELPAGPGLAVFDGKLKGDSIAGDFTQAGIQGKFHLRRDVVKKEETTVEAPLPYRVENVVFHNLDVALAGTLTMPSVAGKHPAVILITGSGPQNRDEELFGFKPFRIIADHLTRKGVAVLRYDDRGVGGSTGNINQSTTADFATDVEQAIRFLKARADINPTQIGLCGHSEGGIVAPMLAARSTEVAFIVLLAGPAISGDSLVLFQVQNLARQGGASKEEIERTLALQRRTFQCVRSDKGWDDLKEEMRKEAVMSLDKMTPEQRKQIADPDKFIDMTITTQLQGVKTPWFKFFATYDPLPALKRVRCPVLALFGERDMQVPVSLNKNPMERAFAAGGNNDYTISIIPGANHLFITAPTGSPLEYAGLKKEFAPGVLDQISDWILKHVTIVK